MKTHYIRQFKHGSKVELAIKEEIDRCIDNGYTDRAQELQRIIDAPYKKEAEKTKKHKNEIKHNQFRL